MPNVEAHQGNCPGVLALFQYPLSLVCLRMATKDALQAALPLHFWFAMCEWEQVSGISSGAAIPQSAVDMV